MEFSKIRENDFYKYGVEVPLIFSAVANLITDHPATCVVPVALGALAAYSEQSGRGTMFSRLFNLAAGTACGILAGVGLDNFTSSLDVNNYIINTGSDVLAALGTYAGIRMIGKAQKPESPAAP
ncbi:MAG: hypothetical protein H6867_08905 [Rhodospirillales bacterium]|nr:hypothetical protein [Rhodospirillales bacterium]MCB9996075.1 hypothetical protein [Rhodospirillales bacterium]